MEKEDRNDRQIMKTQIQHPHLTDGMTLPRRRTTSRTRLLAFMTSALLILTAAPQLKAQTIADGILMAHNIIAITGVEKTFASGSLTSNPDGNFLGAMLVLQPHPQVIKAQFGSALPAGSPDAGTSGTLYGTASVGGQFGFGTVFSLNADGTDFTLLHEFTGGSDGSGVFAGLVLSSNTLYGTTVNGGNNDEGVVFAVDTGDTNFTVLHQFTALNSRFFTNSDGGNPYSQLILASNVLYGTASDGGGGNAGTVFALNLNTTNFTVLHSFAATADDANFNLTNSDGANPHARLLLAGNTLYGTTSSGGTGGAGTVFALNLDNTNFTVLHSFAAVNFLTLTNTDGTSPYDGLILSSNMLYGTASRGGNFNSGTVFAVSTNGTVFTNLYSFTGGSDGALPKGELLLFGNILIGTASAGGDTSLNDGGHGTVFGLNTDGTSFTVLHTFTAGNFDFDLQGPLFVTNSEGANPMAGLIAASNTLYGAANDGGAGGNGTVFSLTFAPAPNILGLTLSGTNLVINGTNALPGETCVTFMSSDLKQPLTNWTAAATNMLNTTGNFTFTATNVVDATVPRRFYVLQTH
jgi:uncharacterized repeat protein (TIGR03803 family)